MESVIKDSGARALIPPFTTEHLNIILKSPLFTGFAADGREHERGNMHADDWRKWLPLVAMFTGARIGEVAQLRIGDVRQEHGTWFIHIRHDEAEGLATKSGRSRPAAVHSRLEEIGFIEFVQRRLEAAESDTRAPLFPELSAQLHSPSDSPASRARRRVIASLGSHGTCNITNVAYRYRVCSPPWPDFDPPTLPPACFICN